MECIKFVMFNSNIDEHHAQAKYVTHGDHNATMVLHMTYVASISGKNNHWFWWRELIYPYLIYTYVSVDNKLLTLSTLIGTVLADNWGGLAWDLYFSKSGLMNKC